MKPSRTFKRPLIVAAIVTFFRVLRRNPCHMVCKSTR